VRGNANVFDAFAEHFGVDILEYDYPTSNGRNAFVVKNSAVLGRPRGHVRQLLPFTELEAKSEDGHLRAGTRGVFGPGELQRLLPTVK
jgi:hypothetical protein